MKSHGVDIKPDKIRTQIQSLETLYHMHKAKKEIKDGTGLSPDDAAHIDETLRTFLEICPMLIKHTMKTGLLYAPVVGVRVE